MRVTVLPRVDSFFTQKKKQRGSTTVYDKDEDRIRSGKASRRVSAFGGKWFVYVSPNHLYNQVILTVRCSFSFDVLSVSDSFFFFFFL